jgi:teichuronic acid biosynthesis glycosyltransferase TuaG
MRMSPFFSIITPVLNGASDVFGYVNCLINQTFADWEVLIVDDGSHDESISLLQSYTAHDQRFRIYINTYKKRVRSPSQARNFGLDRAIGDYICFLDIDDRWLPSYLASQYLLLTTNPKVELTYGSYYRHNKRLHSAVVRFVLPFLNPRTQITLYNPVPMLTACVSRRSLSSIRFKEMNHEDYIFWHEIFFTMKSDFIASYTFPLAIYTVDPKSLSGNKFKVVGWIYRCYRYFGYSKIKSVFFLFLRGALEFVIYIIQLRSVKIRLTSSAVESIHFYGLES